MLKQISLTLLLSVLGLFPVFAQENATWLQKSKDLREMADSCISTAADASGNIYVTGPISEILGDGHGYVTVKYDSTGNVLWAVRSDDIMCSRDLPASIRLDESANVEVMLTNGRGEEVAVICYRPSGQQLWVRRHDHSPQEMSEGIEVRRDQFGARSELSYEEGWPLIHSGYLSGMLGTGSEATASHINVADLEGDGEKEIVVAECLPGGAGHVYVFRHDGTFMKPWPNVDLDPVGLAPSGVTLGDLDRDGDLEILFTAGEVPVTAEYTLYIFHHDGTKVTDGWPKQLDDYAALPPVLEDIDADGFLELICQNGLGKISAWNFDGSSIPGWPFLVPDGGPLEEIAVGDIDDDGRKEVVAVQSIWTHKYVYVISSAGQLLHSWEILNDWPFGVSAIPALADLDKDGDLEILLYACSKVHAYHHNGEYVNGWPNLADTSFYGGIPLSIGDLDRDDSLEVVACSHTWQSGLRVWNHDGTLVEGWPLTLENMVFIYPSAIGNIDGDSELEVLVTALGFDERPQIHAYNWNGTPVEGFPFIIEDTRFDMAGNAVLADVDQDDTLELVFAAGAYGPHWLFMVGVINLSTPNDSLTTEWPMFQHDRPHTGHYNDDYVRGDANRDRRITLSDAVYVVNYLLTQGPAPDPLRAGDANCDGVIDLSDVVCLINYLFWHGPPPDCT